ncbi:MAG: hypothetical protein LKG14_05760 [Prevotella sp.]|uniref:Uncharacterized protein n=1 Tax=Segatella cerevisiae TaxID=2053716 RepID=A0ABT1C1B8_9BACT|nr:hypothetical protein [Prevotella sp.]MCO6026522.1 hypothetical protein [Segatella cerevisiae]
MERLCFATTEGVSLLGINCAADKLGLSSRSETTTIEDLITLSLMIEHLLLTVKTKFTSPHHLAASDKKRSYDSKLIFSFHVDKYLR